MRHEFAKTSNVLRFLQGTQSVAERGATEASWLLVHGFAGYGKSATVSWWCVHTGAAYLRAKTAWTARWALKEIVEAYGDAPQHCTKDLFTQAVAAITRAQDEAEYNAERYPAIVIDEAENTTHDRAILETLRDLSDLTEIPVILVGMGRIAHHLKKRDQIYSRLADIVEFRPNTGRDVRTLCDQLAEVEIADDLVSRIEREAQGRARLILNAIAHIESQAKRNGLTRVSAVHMHGRELVRDIEALAAKARRSGA